MTLTQAIPTTQTKLTFKVLKTTKDNATIESAPYDYSIPSQTPPAAEDKNSGKTAKPGSADAPGGTQPAHLPGSTPEGASIADFP